MNTETEKKIDKLLSEISVREKARQLNQIILSENNVESVRKRLIKGKIGSFYNGNRRICWT